MRDKRIDILKAWGIILVIAGHTHSPFSGWIYTFHMPLFFFVSGFLRYGAHKKSWREFLVGKAKSIIVPYLFFWLISVFIYGNFYSLTKTQQFSAIGLEQIKGLLLGGQYLSKSYNLALWYLPLYFIATVGFEILVRYTRTLGKVLLLGTLVYITIPVQQLISEHPIYQITVFPPAIVFMLLGYGVHYFIANKESINKLKDNLVIGGFLIVGGWQISVLNYGNIASITKYLYFLGVHNCRTIYCGTTI